MIEVLLAIVMTTVSLLTLKMAWASPTFDLVDVTFRWVITVIAVGSAVGVWWLALVG